MSRNESPGDPVRALATITDEAVKPPRSRPGIAPAIGARPPLRVQAPEPPGDHGIEAVVPAEAGHSGHIAMTAPDAGFGSEIELKLLAGAGLLASFRDAPVIAGSAKNRGVRRHLRSVYYDTAGRRLRKAGLSLRVRQSGARCTQAIKAEFGEDPLRRGEWEVSLPGPVPDLSLALPLLPAKLRAKLGHEPLQPVFTADIHRLSRSVTLPSGTVEVSFDHGTLLAGDDTLPVDEIELELKQGATQTLYDLALRLTEHGPLRPSVRSKAARGFDLADRLAPAAPKPEQPVLDPRAPLDEAFLHILRGALRHLLQSLPAAEDGRNPEGIHQARVALRRLRSVFGLMRSVAASPSLDSFRETAKWLADRLGGARDCDIFVGETLSSIGKALPELDGFAELCRVAGEKRADGHAAAQAALTGQRTSRFLLELGGFIEQRGWRGDVSIETPGALGDPAIAFAGRTLADLHARLLKRGRHFKSMTPEKRHKLRIAAKKLRYATDFLLPLYGESRSAKRFAARLAELQDELGRYNDMATTARIVASFQGDPAGMSQAAGAVIGWQAQGLAGAEPRLRSAWRAFGALRAPWAGSAAGS